MFIIFSRYYHHNHHHYHTLIINYSLLIIDILAKTGIKIDSIVQNWITEETVGVEVCLNSGQRIEQSSLTQYDLLITNDLGGSWRESGVSQKTDHRLCFPGVTLKKNDLAKTLTYTVTDSKGNSLIEEMETFLIGKIIYITTYKMYILLTDSFKTKRHINP